MDVDVDEHGHVGEVRVDRVAHEVHVAHGDQVNLGKCYQASVEGYEPGGSWADEVVLVAVVVAVVALQSVEHLRGTYQTDGYLNCKFEQTAASIHCEPF